MKIVYEEEGKKAATYMKDCKETLWRDKTSKRDENGMYRQKY